MAPSLRLVAPSASSSSPSTTSSSTAGNAASGSSSSFSINASPTSHIVVDVGDTLTDMRRRRRAGIDGDLAITSRLSAYYLLAACAAGLIVDPLFIYTLSIDGSMMCLFIDGWFAASLTLLRSIVDAMHLWNTCLHLSSAARRRKKLHAGNGYLASLKGFLLDLFVLLPVMQIVVWVAAPMMIRRGAASTVMTTFLIAFLFHYLPKVYHSISHLRRLHNFSGYIFGTIWWGISLNLIAYFVASHAAGACWYLLGVQRAVKCLSERCVASRGCEVANVACMHALHFDKNNIVVNGSGGGGRRFDWAMNSGARLTCLDSSDNFPYGAYKWTVPLVTNTSRLEKILLPIFWGLMTLSTFGNLESTTEWVEIVFNIIIVTSGLLLVTMLIGNIKVFLHATTSKKQDLNLRMRSMEWWMRRKHVPKGFRQRVRQYERQRWAATRGVDECEMIRNLPEGLRRDIKYHLCLELVRQVPLFQHMDDVVLENICDRVKSLIFPKGETITREGEPVQRMLFIVRGHLESRQVVRNGVESCCMLGPGNFTGDELLSWCLQSRRRRQPSFFSTTTTTSSSSSLSQHSHHQQERRRSEEYEEEQRDRLPVSSSTLVTVETTEAFGLEAGDVRYVTQHFGYTFLKEKVKRSARYYSPAWRTWAAVAIQLAWSRYRHRKALTSLSFIRPRRPLSRSSSLAEDRLRLYAALLASPKPHHDHGDHDDDA